MRKGLTIKVRCEKCDVRIPKNRPMLKCSICNSIKHFKCNGLTKNEAFEIIKNDTDWSCKDCIFSILPVNLVLDVRQTLENCSVCEKKISSNSIVFKCTWCEGRCHKSCVKGQLGCVRCSENIIPGLDCFAHGLLGETFLDSRPQFNPYDQEHTINQLGLHLNLGDEQTLWNDLSERISQCEYSRLKNLPSECNGSPRILSLNIRSLFKGIEKLREDISILREKCDILCLCETNLKLENLANGLDDIALEGFYKPIFRDPHRKSGKGGGLVMYVNSSFCDSDQITEMEISPNPDESQLNPSGEFQFVKIGFKINNNVSNGNPTLKNLIIGNIYRSPSSNNIKFLEHLESHLQKLQCHKNKIIHLVGDFNVDLAKYNTDLNCHELINKMAEHNFAQLISLPTRVTDHTATVIDHVYSNQVHTLIKSRVVTLDISDHLITYVQFNADPNF